MGIRAQLFTIEGNGHAELVINCLSVTYLVIILRAIAALTARKSEMGMNVNLTPYLEDMVRQKINSGLYTSASEVVREALRLMDEQDNLRAAKLEQLRQDIRAGLDSGSAVPWNPDQVKQEGCMRHQRNSISTKA